MPVKPALLCWKRSRLGLTPRPRKAQVVKKDRVTPWMRPSRAVGETQPLVYCVITSALQSLRGDDTVNTVFETPSASSNLSVCALHIYCSVDIPR